MHINGDRSLALTIAGLTTLGLKCSGMDTQVELLTHLALVDGKPISNSWRSPLSASLIGLFESLDRADRTILSHFSSFMERHSSEIESIRETRSGAVSLASGIYKDFPIASTLLGFQKPHKSSGLKLLAAIMLSAALEAAAEASGNRNRVINLSSTIRGALQDPKSSLLVMLAECSTIPELVRRLQLHIVVEEPGFHQAFEKIWVNWLHDTLLRWMLRDPALLRHSLEPGMLVPDLQSPQLSFGSGGTVDADDGVDLQNEILEEIPADESEPTLRTQWRRVEAKALVRASQGDLFSDPDFVVPDEIISRLARLALLQANAHLNKLDISLAEQPAALALAIATGIRELDLRDVVWGEEASDQKYAVDPDRPVFYRAIVRPPNGVNPAFELKEWLKPTTDRIAWPMPGTLHEILKNLAPLGVPISGKPVLPRLAAGTLSPYRLRDVLSSLSPETSIGAGRIRLALAGQLTQLFGPEVVQLVLTDTFSISVAPAYYSSTIESDIISAVATIQKRWFGEEVTLLPERDASVGSRLVLTDDAACQWPKALRQQMRSVAHQHQTDELAAWLAHRDRLAGAFCAVTGHRPTDDIGRICIDQIIPEHCLVILQDKQVDNLRSTRIAATGHRWLADLRDYLDRLVRLTQQTDNSQAKLLAIEILNSQAPLFNVLLPDGSISRVSASSLKASMPAKLQAVSNYYRHHLNQYLQKSGVDFELRHAQMGWIVSPAHVTADLSPSSPLDFGSRLSVVLDKFMVHDGWYPATQRTAPWRWDGIPDRVMKDWDVVAREHAQEHESTIRELRQKLLVQGEETGDLVLPEIAKAVIEFLPDLRVNLEKKELERKQGLNHKSPIEVSVDHHALICDRVRIAEGLDPASAMQAVVTRVLVYRLILRARRKGLIIGPIPWRPRLSSKALASPFPLHMGLAVRHAAAFRQQLLARSNQQNAHDQGYLTTLIVLVFSAYRDLPLATAAAAAAVRGMRNQGDWFRVPAVVDRKERSMVFSGLPALVLSNRGRHALTAKPPSDQQLAEWISSHIDCSFIKLSKSDSLLENVVSTLRMAGRVELSGQERMLMLGHTSMAAVSVERSLAQDDGWPVRTQVKLDSSDLTESTATFELDDTLTTSPVKSDRSFLSGYRKLTAVLNPSLLPGVTGSKSDGHRNWRKKLEGELTKLKEESSTNSNFSMLIGFSIHRLRYGGERVRDLAHNTLHREITRFGSDLLMVLGRKTLVSLESEQLELVYLAVLQGKPASARKQAFDALVIFHQYLRNVHQVTDVSFDALGVFAGPRIHFSNPGMLTDNETRLTLSALRQDLASENVRPDANPDLVRLFTLRILKFLLLEGSGIRPGSCFGLTLGDLCFFGKDRDFVHVRKTGDYGAAKSEASKGYVQLTGALWQENREWAIKWMNQEVSNVANTDWWKAPVFGDASGSVRRFGSDYITGRFNELLKWASNDKKAKTYWLRKNRVTDRHRQAASSEFPKARNVYSALCFSGHADITTPMLSYINDPSVPTYNSLTSGRFAPRSSILSVSHLDGAKLDMAWLRRGKSQSPQRLCTVFDLVKIDSAKPPKEQMTAPPPLRRHQPFSASHVDNYARLLHRLRDPVEAMIRSGLSNVQVKELNRVVQNMLLQRGKTPFPIEQLKHPRAVMQPPRELDGTEALFKLLKSEKDGKLLILCEAWVRQSHTNRIYDSGVVMLLTNADEVSAAEELLKNTALDFEISLEKDGSSVLRPSKKVQKQKSHTAALLWILAIYWVYTHFEPIR